MGTYLLLISLPESCTLKVGKLGRITFPSGYYVYVGSALKNFKARVSRHLRKEKRHRWHIDYFLKKGRVLEIWMVPSEKRQECLINQRVQNNLRRKTLIPHFGSSDCGCSSHLTHFKKKPDLSQIGKRIEIEETGDRKKEKT